jgi:ParB family chromosome partitioning protein
VVRIPLDRIRPNPNQPRTEFAPEALDDLAASIKTQGVLQPVLVRPLPGPPGTYELVAGERRLRASRKAGLAEIPALVRELTEVESLAIALIENLQREDLNAMEEAKGLYRLQETLRLSQEELAKKVGKSRSSVANSLRLLGLPGEMQTSLGRGEITPGHARALLSVPNPAATQNLYEAILAYGLSVRQAETAAIHYKDHGSLPPLGPDGAAAQPAPARPAPGPIRRDGLEERLVRFRDRMASDFPVRVELKGSRDRGRLVFTYKSEAEFAELLARLGYRVEDQGV